MKKTFSSLVIAAAMTFGFVNLSVAEPNDSITDATEVVEEVTTEETPSVADEAQMGNDEEIVADDTQVELSFVQTLKQKYIEGLKIHYVETVEQVLENALLKVKVNNPKIFELRALKEE